MIEKMESVQIQEKKFKQQKTTSTYSYFTDALIMQIVQDLQTRAGYTQEKASSDTAYTPLFDFTGV